MSLITRVLRQTATYWGSPTPDGLGGYTYAAPVSLSVRWTDRQEVIQNSRGEEVVSRSKVFTSIDVESEGYLYLGTSSATDPTTVDDAFKIQRFDKIPDLTANEFLRKAFL